MTSWMERINRAELNGAFTTKDKKLAASFQTCAVGERFRLSDYREEDALDFAAKYPPLFLAGIHFNGAVFCGDFKRVRHWYTEIQNYQIPM